MEISLFVPLFCHFLLLLPSSIPIRKQKTFYSCWRRAWWVWRRWHAVDGPFEMKARPSSLSSAVCARAVSIYWPTSWTVPVCFLFLSLADSVLLFQQKQTCFSKWIGRPHLTSCQWIGSAYGPRERSNIVNALWLSWRSFRLKILQTQTVVEITENSLSIKHKLLVCLIIWYECELLQN